MKYIFQLIILATITFACQPKEKTQELPKLPEDGIAEFYDESKWPFYHGVASGDPLTDLVIIWTRVTPKDSLESIEVSWEMADNANFENSTTGTATTSPDKDYTVKVDVANLSPGTKYFYRFTALEKTSPIGKTRTVPEGEVDQLQFAVISCSNYEFGKFHSYRAVAEEKDINAVLHLGDYIYEYGSGIYGDSTTGRFHYPEKEITSLEDYRLRYSQYRLDADLAAAHQNHPFITIWDDHEIANNSYKDGAQNHQEDEGDYEQRKNWARQVYYEWLPVRESDELYRSFSYGDLADLFMLDERLTGRSAPPDSLNDPSINEAKMLGDKQLEWFVNGLKNSDAQWKVIGNQVIFSYLNWGRASFNINLDSWDGYPLERTAIKSVIIEGSIENVVFVTGDTHSAWAFEVTDSPEENYEAFAIEFGTTSINSGNSNERSPTDSVKVHEQKIVNTPLNPHLKYANLRDHGFMVLTLTPEKAKATWKFVNRKGGYSGITSSHSVEVESGSVELK